MSDKLWKACERELARLLGGKRIPINGRQGADVVTPWLTIEVKERRSLPGWLAEAVGQGQAGRLEGRLPVVALHEAGAPYSEALIVVRLADWLEWFGSDNWKAGA